MSHQNEHYKVLNLTTNKVVSGFPFTDSLKTEFKALAYNLYMPSENTFWLSFHPGEFNEQGQFDASDRWSVPLYNIPEARPDLNLDLWTDTKYSDLGKAFNFELKHPESGDSWLDSKGRSLVYLDKFAWIGFNIQSEKIFGLGERVKPFGFKKGKGNYTGWAWGQDSLLDLGVGGN